MYKPGNEASRVYVIDLSTLHISIDQTIIIIIIS